MNKIKIIGKVALMIIIIGYSIVLGKIFGFWTLSNLLNDMIHIIIVIGFLLYLYVHRLKLNAQKKRI